MGPFEIQALALDFYVEGKQCLRILAAGFLDYAYGYCATI